MKSFSLSVLFLMMLLLAKVCGGQTLSIQQIHAFTFISTDDIEESLLKDGWKRRSLQVVPDSNLIKRSWDVTIKDDGIKSYVLHFEFSKDTGENYIIYQFADRNQFHQIKKELKEMGFKHLNEKSGRKSKSKKENIHKEKEDYFFNEKTQTLNVVKEVFFYGMFSFLVYSYKPNSNFGEMALRSYKK
jgi:hypothetical protein